MKKKLTDVSKYKYCEEKKNLVLQLLEKYNDILNIQIKRKYLRLIIEEKNTVYSYKEKLFASGDVPHSDVIKSGIEVATFYSQISDNKKEFQTLLNQISLIDSKLGSKLFYHLISLPLVYFEYSCRICFYYRIVILFYNTTIKSKT